MASNDYEDVSEMAKHSEKVSFLESRVKGWIKKLDEILKESEQIRRENDSSGKKIYKLVTVKTIQYISTTSCIFLLVIVLNRNRMQDLLLSHCSIHN